jgi:ParB family transcriptional regulator, chromosome partitioning protein
MSQYPTRKEAKSQQKQLIARYRAGNKKQRLRAELMADCGPRHRCNVRDCPVCDRRLKREMRQIPKGCVEKILIGGYGIRAGIDDIVVGKRRRPLNEAKVAFIAASMRQVGQLVPIIVRVVKKRVVLVSGWHRVAAAKSLAWKTILCTHMVGGDDDSQHRDNANAAEIAENLHRVELTALQRAEMINDWRKFVLEKGGQVAPRGGRQPQDLGIKKTAKALGLTREETRRAKRIARLLEKTRVAVVELGLDDNQAALLEIAKQPTAEGQLQAIEDIIARQRAARAQRLSASEQKSRDAISNLESEIINEQRVLETLSGELSEKRSHLRRFKRELTNQREEAPEDLGSSPPTSPDDGASTEIASDPRVDDEALTALKDQWECEGVLRRDKWEKTSALVRRQFIQDVLSLERDLTTRLR